MLHLALLIVPENDRFYNSNCCHFSQHLPKLYFIKSFLKFLPGHHIEKQTSHAAT